MLVKIKELSRKHARGLPPRICVLKCDVCAKIFEKPYGHRKRTIHCCSPRCGSLRPRDYENANIPRGVGSKGAQVVIVNCKQCGVELKPQNKKTASQFCDRKCYGNWRSEHPETFEKSFKMMQTSEVRKRAIATREQRIKSGEIKHPMLGRKHSVKTKRMISEHHKRTKCLNGTKNGMFGKKHTKESKEKMSLNQAMLLVKNLKRPYGKNSQKGTYVPEKMATKDVCYFKSSWELALMKWLDSSDFVKSWEYESLRIAYRYNDNKRWYVPDFVITFQDGTRRMYEIKPKEFVDSERCIKKQIAASAYCQQNNITGYQILTGECLRFMLVI